MTQSTRLDVTSFIDEQPVSGYQRGIVALCFLVLAVDGFDTAGIGFIAPAIRLEFGVTAAALAPVFGAGFFGLLVGALCMGPVADRWGRKPALIMSTVLFGVACLASSAAPDVTWLIVLRFLTGVGLGGAFPNAVTLASEFFPHRKRSMLVTIVASGFTIGSAAGGLISAQVLPHIGWRGVLVIGGILPLLLAGVAWMRLPESVQYLALKGRSADVVAAILRRIAPLPSSVVFTVITPDDRRSPVAELFRRGLAIGTLLLWTAFFMSLLIVYLISSWLPLLLNGLGASLQYAALVTSVFQIGGTLGGISLGWLMDRVDGRRALSVTYVLGAGCVAALGMASGSLGALIVAVFGAGALISGSQTGLNALAASYYSTRSRSTGVSWCTSAGRGGAITGSMAGGTMLSLGLSYQEIFLVVSVAALIAGAAIGVLGSRSPGLLGR